MMSENVLQLHLDQAMKEYMTGNHYDTLIEAKSEYFVLTGQANEDDDDYEARMNSFNDWYILQFMSKRNTRTVIKDYLTNIGAATVSDIAKFTGIKVEDAVKLLNTHDFQLSGREGGNPMYKIAVSAYVES